MWAKMERPWFGLCRGVLHGLAHRAGGCGLAGVLVVSWWRGSGWLGAGGWCCGLGWRGGVAWWGPRDLVPWSCLSVRKINFTTGWAAIVENEDAVSVLCGNTKGRLKVINGLEIFC